MSNENDRKVKEMLNVIEKKRKELGVKPRAAWKTNGIIKLDSSTVNINTINSKDKCIELTAKIFAEKSGYEKARFFLNLNNYNNSGLETLNDILDDLKLKVKIIVWEEDKKKLTLLENKLKDLRSESAKTEDELDSISKSLGI